MGIGFIGAVLGIWLARILGLPNLFNITLPGGYAFPIVYALLGGLLLLLILRLLRI